MAKQTFTTGQVLTAAQMTSLQQTAMLGGAASAKTASYTLVAADAGTAISMSNASATTITVNTALFAEGDTVQITNLGAGVCTITPGSATVNTSATLALAQYESGTLDFSSTSSAVFIKAAGATTSGMTLVQTLTLSGASATSSSIAGTYKHLFVVVKGATGSTNTDFYLRMNSDSGANYFRNVITTSGTTTISAGVTSAQTELKLNDIGTATGASQRVRGNFWVVRYTDTDETFVTAQFLGYEGSQKATVINGVYDNSAAITTITLGVAAGTLSAGTAYIYGVS